MEITIENLNDINIKKLALNKDFGKLKFERSHSYLIELQTKYKELDELDYQNEITQPEATSINGQKQELINLLQRIDQFDIGVVNSQQVHDDIENNVENHYNNAIPKLRSVLTYLKQGVAEKSKSGTELQRQQKAAVQAAIEYKKISAQLKKELEDFKERKKELEKRKIEVEKTHGEVAVKELAYYFDQQADDYTKEARGKQPNFSKIKGRYKWHERPFKWGKKQWIKMKADGGWLRIKQRFYWFLMFIVVANFILYLVVKFWVAKMQVSDIFTLEYGLVKIALISLLYYGMHFAARNYYISSNLAAINKHRKNVAQTFEDFLNTEPDKEVLSQMTKQGTEAMFRHFSSGYLSKTEKQEEGFVNQIINRLPFNKEQ